ncbi:hypothetical protein E3N88_35152 [Mikania micrantha]|uniref:Uncharacterized protein n=1 Tax=Mikania micrantha TaxID=192012 RepID=A0A5N6M0K1_9ASTR|nr:hypothetical protein E3N88_35152 [Mikania micrantha]
MHFQSKQQQNEFRTLSAGEEKLNEASKMICERFQLQNVSIRRDLVAILGTCSQFRMKPVREGTVVSAYVVRVKELGGEK